MYITPNLDNPAQDRLTIEYQMKTKEKLTIFVYDVMGRKIAEWHPVFENNSRQYKYEVAQKSGTLRREIIFRHSFPAVVSQECI